MTDLSSAANTRPASAGARFRAALGQERPLQIVGTINAYHARIAERVGYRAIYLSDRKSTRLNSSHIQKSRMPSSA